MLLRAAQKQKSTLRVSDGERRIKHRRQDFFNRKRVVQRPSHFHHGSQLRQTCASGEGCLPCLDLQQETRQIVVVVKERQFVGVFEAEIDAVSTLQRLPCNNRFTVDEHAVAAAQIFDHIQAVVCDNLRMLA